VSIAYVEHYLEMVPQNSPQPISRRDFPFTAAGIYRQVANITWDSLSATSWDNFTIPWDDPTFFAATGIVLVGDVNGYVYQLNSSQNANGVAMRSFVQYGQTTFDGRQRGTHTPQTTLAISR
jgi:hypothetical protein